MSVTSTSDAFVPLSALYTVMVQVAMSSMKYSSLSLAMVAALTACGGAAEEPTTEATEAETTEEKTEG